MSALLQQVLKEIDQLTPEEQSQVMGHLMNQLQHLTPEEQSQVMGHLMNQLQHLTPEEQSQVMGHLMNQLQHRVIVIAKPDQSLSDSAEEQWDEQIANDLETGRLNQLIAKAEADIKANQVRDLNEILRNP